MRVLFDHQIFSEHVYGGISRYFCSLAHALWVQREDDVRIVSPLHVNQYVQGLPPGLCWGVAVKPRPGTRRAIRAFSNGLSRLMVPAFRPDIVHETYYSTTPTAVLRCPRVVTVFDMIHERCSGGVGGADGVREAKIAAIRRAAHVLCISEHTRQDLMAILGVPEEKITVTYLASGAFPDSGQSAGQYLSSDRPYLLYVGGRFGYKNFDLLLQTWGRVKWLRDNFRVVCFGGGGFSMQEHESMCELGLREGEVVQLSGPDSVLAALYKGASAFVYPSLYEGFGIPPLEAMSQDCPVVCSYSTSIPEVVGDAGEYFDPKDSASLEAALLGVLQSRARRDALIEAGRQRFPLFNWERCAKQTQHAYERAMG